MSEIKTPPANAAHVTQDEINTDKPKRNNSDAESSLAKGLKSSATVATSCDSSFGFSSCDQSQDDAENNCDEPENNNEDAENKCDDEDDNSDDAECDRIVDAIFEDKLDDVDDAEECDDLDVDEDDDSVASSGSIDSNCSKSSQDSSSSSDSSGSEKSDGSADSNNSVRELLRQAQQRMQHQSLTEELQYLRSHCEKLESQTELLLQQKLNLVNKCNSLENDLASATKKVEKHDKKMKDKEDEWNEKEEQFKEIIEKKDRRFKGVIKRLKIKYIESSSLREKDHMNQMNECWLSLEKKEDDWKKKVEAKDAEIEQLENRLARLQGLGSSNHGRGGFAGIGRSWHGGLGRNSGHGGSSTAGGMGRNSLHGSGSGRQSWSIFSTRVPSVSELFTQPETKAENNLTADDIEEKELGYDSTSEYI